MVLPSGHSAVIVPLWVSATAFLQQKFDCFCSCDLILCNQNKKDIDEIPDMYLKGLTFHYVDTVIDVWNFALQDEKVQDAIEFQLDSNGKKNEEGN